MKIVFDPAKDIVNVAKHGISLADADLIEWDTAIIWKDDRHDYQELRMIALAYIGNRLFCVVFVDRYAERRVISLRKANNREIKRYAST